MLQSISIVNFALIDDIQSDFGSQLNVVTGETGSGNLSLWMPCHLCLVLEQTYQLFEMLPKNVSLKQNLSKSTLKYVFDDLEVDFEMETILRREILPSGKSRSFINDTPVQLEKLRFLGSQLVDLHATSNFTEILDFIRAPR